MSSDDEMSQRPFLDQSRLEIFFWCGVERVVMFSVSEGEPVSLRDTWKWMFERDLPNPMTRTS